MKVIGITGPTGAGKTTALHVLRELGAEVIDTDAVYHALLRENGGLKSALVSSFGERILNGVGEVDRKALAREAYPNRLSELNAVTHPFVVEEVDRRITAARQEGRSVPLLKAVWHSGAMRSWPCWLRGSCGSGALWPGTALTRSMPAAGSWPSREMIFFGITAIIHWKME